MDLPVEVFKMFIGHGDVLLNLRILLQNLAKFFVTENRKFVVINAIFISFRTWPTYLVQDFFCWKNFRFQRVIVMQEEIINDKMTHVQTHTEKPHISLSGRGAKQHEAHCHTHTHTHTWREIQADANFKFTACLARAECNDWLNTSMVKPPMTLSRLYSKHMLQYGSAFAVSMYLLASTLKLSRMGSTSGNTLQTK